MSHRLTSRQITSVAFLLAATQFVLQVSLLAKGVEYIAGSLMIDDSYYYLQTAWNTKQLGFVTFDGLHPTNGVQLSWFAIILLLALLVKTKTALLFSTLVVTFLLNGLCYLVILKIGFVLKQSTLALFMVSLWALQSLPYGIYSMAMENSLHALVVWSVIWQSIVFLVRVRKGEKPNFVGLTAVLIINAWTRLDSALLSIVVYTFCIAALASTYRGNYSQFLKKHLKGISASSLFAGFGLITQLGAFWLMGNSFLPVSALVKTSGESRGLGRESVEKLVEVLSLGMPSILQERFPPETLVLVWTFGVLLVIVARIAFRRHFEELATVFNLWLCLLIGELLYHAYIAVSGVQYTPYFIWYRSPSFIFWIVTGSLLAYLALTYARQVKQLFGVLDWMPVAFSLIAFIGATFLFIRKIDFASELYVARYHAALWIEQNSSPNTVFAAWNTGQLAFFSNRTFINLDGVINSRDYYERVLQGSTPLAEYLIENKVDYLVDYTTYASLPSFPVERTFPLNDEFGRSIQIWRVSSQLSTAQ